MSQLDWLNDEGYIIRDKLDGEEEGKVKFDSLEIRETEEDFIIKGYMNKRNKATDFDPTRIPEIPFIELYKTKNKVIFDTEMVIIDSIFYIDDTENIPIYTNLGTESQRNTDFQIGNEVNIITEDGKEYIEIVFTDKVVFMDGMTYTINLQKYKHMDVTFNFKNVELQKFIARGNTFNICIIFSDGMYLYNDFDPETYVESGETPNGQWLTEEPFTEEEYNERVPNFIVGNGNWKKYQRGFRNEKSNVILPHKRTEESDFIKVSELTADDFSGFVQIDSIRISGNVKHINIKKLIVTKDFELRGYELPHSGVFLLKDKELDEVYIENLILVDDAKFNADITDIWIENITHYRYATDDEPEDDGCKWITDDGYLKSNIDFIGKDQINVTIHEDISEYINSKGEDIIVKGYMKLDEKIDFSSSDLVRIALANSKLPEHGLIFKNCMVTLILSKSQCNLLGCFSTTWNDGKERDPLFEIGNSINKIEDSRGTYYEIEFTTIPHFTYNTIYYIDMKGYKHENVTFKYTADELVAIDGKFGVCIEFSDGMYLYTDLDPENLNNSEEDPFNSNEYNSRVPKKLNLTSHWKYEDKGCIYGDNENILPHNRSVTDYNLLSYNSLIYEGSVIQTDSFEVVDDKLTITIDKLFLKEDLDLITAILELPQSGLFYPVTCNSSMKLIINHLILINDSKIKNTIGTTIDIKQITYCKTEPDEDPDEPVFNGWITDDGYIQVGTDTKTSFFYFSNPVDLYNDLKENDINIKGYYLNVPKDNGKIVMEKHDFKPSDVVLSFLVISGTPKGKLIFNDCQVILAISQCDNLKTILNSVVTTCGNGKIREPTMQIGDTITRYNNEKGTYFEIEFNSIPYFIDGITYKIDMLSYKHKKVTFKFTSEALLAYHGKFNICIKFSDGLYLYNDLDPETFIESGNEPSSPVEGEPFTENEYNERTPKKIYLTEDWLVKERGCRFGNNENILPHNKEDYQIITTKYIEIYNYDYIQVDKVEEINSVGTAIVDTLILNKSIQTNKLLIELPNRNVFYLPYAEEGSYSIKKLLINNLILIDDSEILTPEGETPFYDITINNTTYCKKEEVTEDPSDDPKTEPDTPVEPEDNEYLDWCTSDGYIKNDIISSIDLSNNTITIPEVSIGDVPTDIKLSGYWYKGEQFDFDSTDIITIKNVQLTGKYSSVQKNHVIFENCTVIVENCTCNGINVNYDIFGTNYYGMNGRNSNQEICDNIRLDKVKNKDVLTVVFNNNVHFYQDRTYFIDCSDIKHREVYFEFNNDCTIASGMYFCIAIKFSDGLYLYTEFDSGSTSNGRYSADTSIIRPYDPQGSKTKAIWNKEGNCIKGIEKALYWYTKDKTVNVLPIEEDGCVIQEKNTLSGMIPVDSIRCYNNKNEYTIDRLILRHTMQCTGCESPYGNVFYKLKNTDKVNIRKLIVIDNAKITFPKNVKVTVDDTDYYYTI